MINAGSFIKQLRKRGRLSQRKFAEAAGISFRQIQRLEKNQSDITLNKFSSLLEKYGLDLKVIAQEPDWNVLVNFGMPINLSNNIIENFKYNIIYKNILTASYFLLENKYNIDYMRHFDSFKALLLALKIHYPSRFKEIEFGTGLNLSESYDFDNILGRHIKLRNICLSKLSLFFMMME